MKTLDNVNIEDAKNKVSDIKATGNGDTFQLICKVSSEEEGWMKSTKAMEVEGSGVVIQVTTQQKNADSSYSVAEALTFVPNASIGYDSLGNKQIVGDVPGMISVKQLRDALISNSKGVAVHFTKSDGSQREMHCTLNALHLPAPTEATKEKKERKKSEDPNLFVVWDLDKEAWRSFNYQNVFKIEVK
jgi:hypothetical protein